MIEAAKQRMLLFVGDANIHDANQGFVPAHVATNLASALSALR